MKKDLSMVYKIEKSTSAVIVCNVQIEVRPLRIKRTKTPAQAKVDES
jgi:hypothetical protein